MALFLVSSFPFRAATRKTFELLIVRIEQESLCEKLRALKKGDEVTLSLNSSDYDFIYKGYGAVDLSRTSLVWCDPQKSGSEFFCGKRGKRTSKPKQFSCLLKGRTSQEFFR